LFVEATHGIIGRMVRPISLRIRHAKILSEARAALGRGREQQLKQAHNTSVMERARGIVAQAREQDRLRRCAKLAAFKALHAARDAFANISSSSTSEVDRERWRERQELVERELREIMTRASK
jgi:hypothetical protein